MLILQVDQEFTTATPSLTAIAEAKEIEGYVGHQIIQADYGLEFSLRIYLTPSQADIDNRDNFPSNVKLIYIPWRIEHLYGITK